MLCALKKFYNLGALGFPRGSQPPPLGPKIYIFGDSGNLVYEQKATKPYTLEGTPASVAQYS